MSDESMPWLCAACALIESISSAQVSVEEVAAAVDVAPQRLIRGFRDGLGFTPSEYVEYLCSIGFYGWI